MIPISCTVDYAGFESRFLPVSQYWRMTFLFGVLTLPFRWPFLILESIRERRAFRGNIETAWAYCEAVWNKPYVHAWQRLIHTSCRPHPPAARLLTSRFGETFPNCGDFLVNKAESENPVIAAYVVGCLRDPNILSAKVLDRKEIIVLRDWFFETKMPLGEWVKRNIDEHNRAMRFFEEAGCFDD